MRNIRFGKAIHFTLVVLTNGERLPLEGRNLTCEISDTYGRKQSIPFVVSGSVIQFDFLPNQQRVLGKYIITITEDKGEDTQNIVDIDDVVNLVRLTSDEGGQDNPNIESVTIDLGIANLSCDDLADAVFIGEKVSTLQDDDEVLIRRGRELKKTTASVLRDYTNYGIKVEFKN